MYKTIPIETSSKGHFSISKKNSSGKVLETYRTDNVVTYEGAFYSLTDARLTLPLYAAVGTGSTEITRSSTSLGNQSGGRSGGEGASRSGNEVDNLDGTSTLTLTRELSFGLGSKVGTFSEVGLYSDDRGGVLVAGQLIKDEFGDPTTITVLSDEQLSVVYTLEWTVPNTSVLAGTGTVTDANSNTYRYEVWAQPFFCEYEVGESYSSSRISSTKNNNVVAFRKANGTTGITVPSTGGWDYSNWGQENGVGNIFTKTLTFSPSSFSYTDIVFVQMFLDRTSHLSRSNIVDTSIALSASYGSPSYTPAVVVKFLDPLTKTADDTLSFKVEVSYNL